jgi:hypothetical protein
MEHRHPKQVALENHEAAYDSRPETPSFEKSTHFLPVYHNLRRHGACPSGQAVGIRESVRTFSIPSPLLFDGPPPSVLSPKFLQVLVGAA